jgi:hypothetical protein
MEDDAVIASGNLAYPLRRPGRHLMQCRLHYLAVMPTGPTGHPAQAPLHVYKKQTRFLSIM